LQEEPVLVLSIQPQQSQQLSMLQISECKEVFYCPEAEGVEIAGIEDIEDIAYN